MAICEICYDSGKVEGVGYCGCEQGKARKAEVEKKTKARKSVATKKQPTTIEVNIPSNYEYESAANNNPIYREGDWVEFPFLAPMLNNKEVKVIGYITRVWPYECTIQTVGLRKVGAFDHKARRSIGVIEPLKIDIKQDINSLIDLALQTKDKEWFKQLTKGMK